MADLPDGITSAPALRLRHRSLEQWRRGLCGKAASAGTYFIGLLGADPRFHPDSSVVPSYSCRAFAESSKASASCCPLLS